MESEDAELTQAITLNGNVAEGFHCCRCLLRWLAHGRKGAQRGASSAVEVRTGMYYGGRVVQEERDGALAKRVKGCDTHAIVTVTRRNCM